MAPTALPKLPRLLNSKLYKTGQTRGADDDEIYQNRVSRSSTVLIPYSVWRLHFTPDQWADRFGNGYIVLISPDQYFADPAEIAAHGLVLGINALVFYETRSQWTTHNPEGLHWTPANSRLSPLGGQYVARISATTAVEGGGRIALGFTTTTNKGAGIRVYEYASESDIRLCRYQLEALFWLCLDSHVVALDHGMNEEDAVRRRAEILRTCEAHDLLDYQRLVQARILNEAHRTVCPLCLEELSSIGFLVRMQQAVGREILDLTVTQINLFHIEELRMGGFNHRPYNLGWGHHHCNVVVKDSGIQQTLEWMNSVLQRNIDGNHFPIRNRGN